MNDLKNSIARNKHWNNLFMIIGLLSTLVGFFLLTALMIDLFMDGAERLSYKFLASFPSRFPEEAGILSAWVGSVLLLLVTVFAAIPIGIAAGIYLEEYASKNWLTDLI